MNTSRPIRPFQALLALAASLFVLLPAYGQTSLFEADSSRVVNHWQRISALDSVADHLWSFCQALPGNLPPLQVENGELATHHCRKAQFPAGFPGRPVGQLWVMTHQDKAFAVAMQMNEDDPDLAAPAEQAFLDSLGDHCACRFITGELTQCQCKEGEVRVLRDQGRFATMFITDMETFLRYKDHPLRREDLPDSNQSQTLPTN